MQVEQRAELDFALQILKRMRLTARTVAPDDAMEELDLGLRASLGVPEEYQRTFEHTSHWARERTIYCLMDQFRCNYIFFILLPQPDMCTVTIGPYLSSDMSREAVMELAEELGIPSQHLPFLCDYYAGLPVVEDTTPLMAIVNTLAESCWGSACAFDTIEMGRRPALQGEHRSVFAEQPDILVRMKALEARYAHENEMMEMVSRGMVQRAELMLSGISRLNFSQRVADPLRNLKNYGVICNTLLRKAAERGGVHPIHLDKTSDEFARTIENTANTEACLNLLNTMIQAYCRLVRTHTINRYSPVIQKALTYIGANLAGELSLRSLAEVLTISPSYLSSLFRQETGQTLTDYVNRQRMEQAVHLLRTTHLQVQTIAQHCGFTDVNYFSKLFKKHYGMTPKQYRLQD